MNIQTHNLRNWLLRHKATFIRIGVGLFILLMGVQIFYPANRMLLFASIDGVSVSGWTKSDTIAHLNSISRKQQIAITLGSSNDIYTKVKPANIGLNVSHQERVNNSSYPWYLRIVPTSLFWFGPLQAEKPAVYKSDQQKVKTFLTSKLGESCNIPPADATLKVSNGTLVVVTAKDGGTCKQDEAVAALRTVKPVVNQAASVAIPVDISTPNVSNKAAKAVADKLNNRSRAGVQITVGDDTQTLTQKEVLSWLVFTSENKSLVFDFDTVKANEYLSKVVAPKIIKLAGVTKVTTLDYTETARVNGASGQALGVQETLGSVKKVLEGSAVSAQAVAVNVAPKVEYTRTYTKTSTGISALLQHYGEDNPGTFGVSFTELGGRGLSASYNSNKSFITASTYKLFVAYSVLTRIEKDEWKWSDDVTGGRNVSTCFDDMIVKSDNACAEAMYKKIGYKTVINEARALGLPNTTLAGDGQRTSAGDLATFLTKLESKTIGLKDENRSKLIEAMKRNVYRQGVPAGANGTVADKVGFLNGLLHDATIVYSPKGTYVLVVMTDGSSWGSIAELTRKIEALR